MASSEPSSVFMTSPSLSAASLDTAEAPRKSGRGRKRDDSLPYNRNRDVQRAFRARRTAHLENLESRVQELEHENAQLRDALDLPPSERPPLGKGPTGRGKPIMSRGLSYSTEWTGDAEAPGECSYDPRSPSPSASESSPSPTAANYPTTAHIGVQSLAQTADSRTSRPSMNPSSNYEFHSTHPTPSSSLGIASPISGRFTPLATTAGYDTGLERYPHQATQRGAVPSSSSRAKQLYRLQDSTEVLGDKHSAPSSWGRDAKISDRPLHGTSTAGIVRAAPSDTNNAFAKGEWTRTRAEEIHPETVYIAESLSDQSMNWTSGPPLPSYSTVPDSRRLEFDSASQPTSGSYSWHPVGSTNSCGDRSPYPHPARYGGLYQT